ncbi:MAG: hypothetical protein EBQ96_05935 [Proteobacteria bacterium]|nr:hypothetical protein [Pseudomonadota bacterium]
MKRAVILFSVLVLLFVGAAEAQQQFKGQKRMNGYSLEQFGNFTKDWKLVTVRYRHDSNEMRFTFANDAAWKTLAAGKTDYPDGAVFAKMGFITEEDPAFPSSAVPSGARRYQLMVKDSKKHAETDGWGYALFGADGLTTDEDPVIKTQACHACHAIVPERGYVFSKPMQLAMPADIKADAKVDEILGARLVYETVDVASLPERLKNLVPAQFKQVRMLQGALRKHLFAGTLDEIRPALILEVNASKLPALLLAEDGSMYSLVYPDPAATACKAKSGAAGVTYKAHHTVGEGMQGDRIIDYCQAQ